MNDKQKTEIKTAIVTGAFSYQGKYIAKMLLKKGYKVKTMTGHPDNKSDLSDKIEVIPYRFERPHLIAHDLEGADLFVNTYWVRFEKGASTHGRAVANTQNLVRACKEAGVRRFVHISISNPSLDSPLTYFAGKAALEETIGASGISYAIIRPTVLFGIEDILINNIAWMLRRFPVFGVFGKGDYRIQPVFVGDVAPLVADLGGSDDNTVVDAVGPETFAYADMVRLIRDAVGVKRPIVPVPPLAGWAFGRMMGVLLRDVPLTRKEIKGLMDGLLVADTSPSCPTSFSKWVTEHGEGLGRSYSSEMSRHYR